MNKKIMLFGLLIIVLVSACTQNIGGEAIRTVDTQKHAENKKVGYLEVITDPASATIYVDNRSRGQSPKLLTLPVGTFRVDLKKPLHETYTAYIDIMELQTTVLNVTLVPINTNTTGNGTINVSGKV